MAKVILLKIYDSYNYNYEANETFIKSVSESLDGKELSDADIKQLKKKIDLFNANKWKLKSVPAYNLLLVEDVTEIPLSELFSELEAAIEEEEKKKAADAEKKRKAAEKRKAANAEADRLKKLKQLEKLQEELGLST